MAGTKKSTIFLANLYPNFGTRSNQIKELEIYFKDLKSVNESIINEFVSSDINKIEIDSLKKFVKKDENSYYYEEYPKGIKIGIRPNLGYKKGSYKKDGLSEGPDQNILIDLKISNNKVEKIRYLNLDIKVKTNKILVEKEIITINSLNQRNKHKHKIEFKYTQISNINTLSEDKLNKSSLIIPGVIPYNRIEEDNILFTNDLDFLLKPFKNITFLSYPGYNLNKIISDLEKMEKFIFNEDSELYKGDLKYSLERTNFKIKNEFITELLKTCEEKVKENSKENGKNKINSPFSFMEEDFSTKYTSENSNYSSYENNYDYITLRVKFESGKTKEINLRSDLLIRKLNDGKLLLKPVKEVSVGDKITYVERETIDNLLLNEFFPDINYKLEKISRPLTELRTFYMGLKDIDFKENDPIPQSKITNLSFPWLSEEKKKTLIQILYYGINNNKEKFDRQFKKRSNPWSGFIDKEVFWNSIKNEDSFSKHLLYNLIKKFGWELAESTFKVYTSKFLDNNSHYYFKKDKHIKSIGKLIADKKIIYDYKEINIQGKELTKALTIIGKSISRVVSNKSMKYNELDRFVEKHIKPCEVLDIS